MRWKRRGVIHTEGQRGVVVWSSISRHDRHSAWQWTEQRLVCRDTGIMGMSWASRDYSNTGVMEIGCATWSVHSGDPGVHRAHPYYLIIQWNTQSLSPNFWSHTVCPRFSEFSQPGSIILCHHSPTLLEPEPDFIMHSLWMPREIWRSVDNGLCVI